LTIPAKSLDDYRFARAYVDGNWWARCLFIDLTNATQAHHGNTESYYFGSPGCFAVESELTNFTGASPLHPLFHSGVPTTLFPSSSIYRLTNASETSRLVHEIRRAQALVCRNELASRRAIRTSRLVQLLERPGGRDFERAHEGDRLAGAFSPRLLERHARKKMRMPVESFKAGDGRALLLRLLQVIAPPQRRRAVARRRFPV